MGFPVDNGCIFSDLMFKSAYDSGTLAPNNKPVDAARSLLPSDASQITADQVQAALQKLAGGILIPYAEEPATPVLGCIIYLVDTGTAYTVRIKWPNGDVEDVSTHDYATA